jgi:hypothetical protein
VSNKRPDGRTQAWPQRTAAAQKPHPPHPATVPVARPPHPATVAQAKRAAPTHGATPPAPRPAEERAPVAQPLFAALGAAAAYVPHVAIGAAATYAANTFVERVTGRNIVGHLAYYILSDAVVKEVFDRASQAGIKPYSTQTHNGYTYKIDAFCRTYSVSGWVKRRVGGRRFDDVNPLVRATGDQNGHIIADSLDGPIAACNFVGMSAYHNNSVGAAPDEETYARMEGAARYILDHETMLVVSVRNGVRNRVSEPFVKAWIEVTLRYPAWSAASRSAKLDYFRPSELDVRITAYTASGATRGYPNPTLPNVVGGHLGVRNINQSHDPFVNTSNPPGATRRLVGEAGY